MLCLSVHSFCHRPGAPEETYQLVVVEEGSTKTFVCFACIKWTKDGVPLKQSATVTVKRIAEMCLLSLNEIAEGEAGNYTCHRRSPTGVQKETKEIFVFS